MTGVYGGGRWRPRDEHTDSGHGRTRSTEPLSLGHGELVAFPSSLPVFSYLPLHAAALSKRFLSLTAAWPPSSPLLFCQPGCHTLLSPLRSVLPSICSFCLFALFLRGCLSTLTKKWVLTAPPDIPVPFFFFLPPRHCVLQQSPLFAGDVKRSRNAPCKGKKGDDTISFIVP